MLGGFLIKGTQNKQIFQTTIKKSHEKKMQDSQKSLKL